MSGTVLPRMLTPGDSRYDLRDPKGRLVWVQSYLPDPAPSGWRIRERGLDGCAYASRSHLLVILSGNREADGRRWLHLSCSYADRLPTWADMRRVKDLFLGSDTYAAIVFPPRSTFVNIHPFCLHLFACVDGWPLPEFSGFLPSGGRAI
jgi:hypothetical protein